MVSLSLCSTNGKCHTPSPPLRPAHTLCKSSGRLRSKNIMEPVSQEHIASNEGDCQAAQVADGWSANATTLNGLSSTESLGGPREQRLARRHTWRLQQQDEPLIEPAVGRTAVVCLVCCCPARRWLP